MSELRFFYNGIKGSSKKLQKCLYSKWPDGSISIYAREYKRFDADVREHFVVKNDSDAMVDHFEEDTIRVFPDHPLYNDVVKAVEALDDHRKKKHEKRMARFAR